MMSGFLRRISLAVFLMTASSASAQDEGHTMDPLDQVKARVEAKKAILVDVRERKEWDRGHVRGAVLLPLSQLMRWEKNGLSQAEKDALVKALPMGTVVYCHCAAGGRSLPGGEVLRKFGYDARPLKPGYGDLIEAGFPGVSGK